jgi:hypothetical protein
LELTLVTPNNFTINMRTFSSLLPLVITVTTLIIYGGLSVVALGNKNAAANSRDGRNVKATNNVQQSTIIEGSYIIRLNDKTSAAKVKTVASATATKMQTLKLQLIANGTLQATSNDVVNVPTDRIFTKSVNAFLINGVSEVMVSSLWQTAGVVSVEPNRVVSIDKLRSESAHKSHVSDHQRFGSKYKHKPHHGACNELVVQLTSKQFLIPVEGYSLLTQEFPP